MRILIFGILFLIAFATVVIGIGSYLAPNDLRYCDAHPSEKPGCDEVDAIVAISGGDTSARTAEAISLYKNGWAELLVFSGAAADKEGPSNAEAMRRQALAAGVDVHAILIDETSETTKQNANNTANLFQSRGIQSVILVTSAYHQRRAGLEFRQHAGDATNIINHPVAQDNQWSSTWWLTPTGWWLALSELVKIALFFVGGSR